MTKPKTRDLEGATLFEATKEMDGIGAIMEFLGECGGNILGALDMTDSVTLSGLGKEEDRVAIGAVLLRDPDTKKAVGSYLVLSIWPRGATLGEDPEVDGMMQAMVYAPASTGKLSPLNSAGEGLVASMFVLVGPEDYYLFRKMIEDLAPWVQVAAPIKEWTAEAIDEAFTRGLNFFIPMLLWRVKDNSVPAELASFFDELFDGVVGGDKSFS